MKLLTTWTHTHTHTIILRETKNMVQNLVLMLSDAQGLFLAVSALKNHSQLSLVNHISNLGIEPQVSCNPPDPQIATCKASPLLLYYLSSPIMQKFLHYITAFLKMGVFLQAEIYRTNFHTLHKTLKKCQFEIRNSKIFSNKCYVSRCLYFIIDIICPQVSIIIISLLQTRKMTTFFVSIQ